MIDPAEVYYVGFSVSGTYAVLFVGLLMASSMLYGAFDASIERTIEGASEDYQARSEQTRTAIEISNVTYDEDNEVLTVNVTNTGSTILDVNATDLVIDNEYYNDSTLNDRRVDGSPNASRWRPDEVLHFNATVADPVDVLVMTEHGVSTFYGFSEPEVGTHIELLWPQYAYKTNNTGHRVGDGPRSKPLTVDWTYETGQRVRAAPTLLAKTINNTGERSRLTVYIGSDDGYLYSLDGRAGYVRWRENVGGKIPYGAALSGNRVYVSRNNDSVISLYRENGSIDWETPIPNSPTIETPPALYNDTVYVGDARGNVTAMYASNGTIRWNRDYGDGIAGPLAADNGTIYLADTSNYIKAVNASTGDVLWETQTDKAPASGLALGDGALYYGSTEKEIHGVATNGTKLWTVAPKGGHKFLTVPAVANETVYASDANGYVYAIWADNGTIRWNYEPSNYSTQFRSSPSVVDDTVYVGNDDGRIVALVPANGTERWVYKIDGTPKVRSSPAIVEGRLYIGADDAIVRTLEEDG